MEDQLLSDEVYHRACIMYYLCEWFVCLVQDGVGKVGDHVWIRKYWKVYIVC